MRWTPLLLAPLLALALMAQGCSGGASTGPGKAASPASPAATLAPVSAAAPAVAPSRTTASIEPAAEKPARPALKPDPIKVKALPQEGKGTRALLPASGGTLEATGADGTRFKLEIPKDALLTPEIITITPLGKVEGLPLSGGLIGGVHLEPEGLPLIRPATLTIEVPSGFDMKELMGFAYQGSGEEFQLYPVRAQGNTITVKLMHFSGYGGGRGNEGDAANMQNHQPSSALAQAQQQAAQIIDNGRRQGKGMGSIIDELEPIFREFFYSTVYPELKAAETNDKLLPSALAQLVSWGREIELDGIRDRFNKEFALGFQSLERGIKNAYKKAFERCVDNPDIDEGFKMIAIGREAALLNGYEGMNFDDVKATVYPDIKQCFAYRLDYESIIERDIGGQMKITSQVRSKVPLELTDDFLSLTGRAPLEYLKFDVEVAGEAGAALDRYCPLATEKHNSTMSCDFVLSQALKDPSNKSGGGFALIDPGSPRDGYRVSCPGIFGDPGHDRYWLTGFQTVNEDRFVDRWYGHEAPAWLFNGFQPGNKPLIGRLTGTNSKTVGGQVITETFTMELFHDPKK